MISKIIEKLKKPAILYTLSSLIYSFSTYIILLFIPYKLNLGSMAEFAAVLNIVMMISFIFELGVVTSFLRYNQLYSVTKYINSYMQIVIFIIMILFSETFLGDYLDSFFGANNLSLDRTYIYFAAFAILSWVFFKNIFLANKKIGTIFVNAVILTVLRIAFLLYILLSSNSFSMDMIYLYLFIAPFALIILYNLSFNLHSLKESLAFVGEKRYRKIFYKRFKEVLFFALTTYIISILYVYSSRYPILYLTKHNATKLLAELGYATSIGGMIIIFTVSIRSYMISKFNISNIKEIKEYIATLSSYKVKFLIFSPLFSAAIALIIYLIKPKYLTVDTAIYVFILVESYLAISYLGMFSLLSKTFNFNNIELKLNIIRLLIVFLWVHFMLISHPLIGFFGLNFSMVLVELFFAKMVLDRVKIKK